MTSKTLTISTVVKWITDFGFSANDLASATTATIQNTYDGHQCYYTTNGTTPSGSSAYVAAQASVVVSGNSAVEGLKLFASSAQALDITIQLRNVINNVLETKSLSVSNAAVTPIADFNFNPLLLDVADNAVVSNTYATDRIIFASTDGADPTIADIQLLPLHTPTTVSGQPSIAALRFVRGDDSDAPATVITNTTLANSFAIGSTIYNVKNLELFTYPMLVRECRPIQYSQNSMSIYGFTVGHGFPRTVWIMDLSQEMYEQLHALLNNQQSTDVIVVTRKPHDVTQFESYSAILKWPQDPNQYRDFNNFWYMGLPLEFSRMREIS